MDSDELAGLSGDENAPTQTARPSYIRPTDMGLSGGESTFSPRQSYAILSSGEIATASPGTPAPRPSYVDRSERVSPLSPPRLTRSVIDRAPARIRRPDSDSVTSFAARPVSEVEAIVTKQSELPPSDEMLELDASELDEERDENDQSETGLDLAQHTPEPLDYVALRKFFFEDDGAAAPVPKKSEPPKRVTVTPPALASSPVVAPPSVRASKPFIAPSVRASSPLFEERPVTRRGRSPTPATDLRVHTAPLGHRILPPAPPPAPVRSYDESTPVFDVSARRTFPESMPTPASVPPDSWRESSWVLPSKPSFRPAHVKPFKLELSVVVAVVTGLLAFSVMVAAIMFVRSDDARFDAKAHNGFATQPPAAADEPPPAAANTASPVSYASAPARPAMTTKSVAPSVSTPRKKHQVLFAKPDPARQEPPRIDPPKAAKKANGKSVEALLDELGEEQLRR